MKSILITGYKGMIGSRLYAYLKALDLYDIQVEEIRDFTGKLLAKGVSACREFLRSTCAYNKDGSLKDGWK